MNTPKIIVIPGSKRLNSVNSKLAVSIAQALNENGAEATAITLGDFEMPIYDGDIEENAGVPKTAKELAALIGTQQGVVLVNPEYNGSFSGLMKNTLDWLSRDVGVNVFQNRAFALAACSPGMLGGIRVLSHARDNLVSVGADVITPQLAVGSAGNAFADDGSLTNERTSSLLQNLCETLIERSRQHI